MATISLGCLLLGPLAASAQAKPDVAFASGLSAAGRSNPSPRSRSTRRATRWRSGSGTRKPESSKPATGRWEASGREPVELSAAGHRAEDQVALDSQGDATAVWWRNNGVKNIIEAASRPACGHLAGARRALSCGPGCWGTPNRGRSSGRRGGDMDERHHRSGEPTAGGTWQAPVELSARPKIRDVPQGCAQPPGRRGGGLASATAAPSSIIEAASRPAGGAWQTPVELSAAGREGMQAPGRARLARQRGGGLGTLQRRQRNHRSGEPPGGGRLAGAGRTLGCGP